MSKRRFPRIERHQEMGRLLLLHEPQQHRGKSEYRIRMLTLGVAKRRQSEESAINNTVAIN
ncbi:hypothetical protein D3C73_1581760 [compost metagenome]